MKLSPTLFAFLALIFALAGISRLTADDVVWRKQFGATLPTSVSLSSAGVGASVHGDTVIVWNMATGDTIRTFQRTNIETGIFHNVVKPNVLVRSDGKKLFVNGVAKLESYYGKLLVYQWDIQTGNLDTIYITPEPKGNSPIYVLRNGEMICSPDGTNIALGADYHSPNAGKDVTNGVVAYIDCYQQSLTSIITIYDREPSGLLFSPSGNYLHVKANSRFYYHTRKKYSINYAVNIDGPFLHSPDDEYVVWGNWQIDFPPTHKMSYLSTTYTLNDRFLSTHQILKFSFDKPQFASIINLPKDTTEYVFSDSVLQNNYALSPDGKYLATIGSDGAVTLRKMPDLQPLSIRAGMSVPDTVILKDSTYFQNTTLPFSTKFRYLWDFGDGSRDTAVSPKHNFQTPGLFTVSMIVYDSVSMLSDTARKSVYVRPVSKHIVWLTNAAKSVTSLGFSSASDRIVAGSQQGKLAVLNVQNGEILKAISASDIPTKLASFIQADSMIVSYHSKASSWSSNGKINTIRHNLCKWNIRKDSVEYTVTTDIGPSVIYAVQIEYLTSRVNPTITSDGKFLISSHYALSEYSESADPKYAEFYKQYIGFLMYYNTENNNLNYSRFSDELDTEFATWCFPAIYAVSASKNSKYVISIENKDSINSRYVPSTPSYQSYLTLREMGKYRNVIRRIPDNSSWVKCSSDGFHVLAANSGLWNIWDSVQVQPGTVGVPNFEFLPDGIHGLVVLNRSDTVAGIYNHQIRKYAHYFTGYPEKVTVAAVSPDGKYLATGSENGNVALWRIPDTLKGKRNNDFAVPLSIRTGLNPGDSVQFYNTSLPANEQVQWEWDFGNSATSNERNPTAVYRNPGKYTVRLTASRAGEQPQTIVKEQYIVVGGTSDVAADELACMFSISPNPATDVVSVRFAAAAAGGYSVVVSDAFGREVMSAARETASPGQQTLELNASALPVGAYSVRVSVGNAVLIGRFVVAR